MSHSPSPKCRRAPLPPLASLVSSRRPPGPAPSAQGWGMAARAARALRSTPEDLNLTWPTTVDAPEWVFSGGRPPRSSGLISLQNSDPSPVFPWPSLFSQRPLPGGQSRHLSREAAKSPGAMLPPPFPRPGALISLPVPPDDATPHLHNCSNPVTGPPPPCQLPVALHACRASRKTQERASRTLASPQTGQKTPLRLVPALGLMSSPGVHTRHSAPRMPAMRLCPPRAAGDSAGCRVSPL